MGILRIKEALQYVCHPEIHRHTSVLSSLQAFYTMPVPPRAEPPGSMSPWMQQRSPPCPPAYSHLHRGDTQLHVPAYQRCIDWNYSVYICIATYYYMRSESQCFCVLIKVSSASQSISELSLQWQCACKCNEVIWDVHTLRFLTHRNSEHYAHLLPSPLTGESSKDKEQGGCRVGWCSFQND